MELLGESLHKSSSKDHLSHSRLAKAFRQTCQAVSHLHGMLVAHLDIKPSSICWKDYSSCSIKLIDFDSALQLKHHDQVLPRLHGDLCVQSAKSPCLALDEDNYMTGHTLYTLIGETHAIARQRSYEHVPCACCDLQANGLPRRTRCSIGTNLSKMNLHRQSRRRCCWAQRRVKISKLFG